jgi:hypothetical protein
MTIEGTVYNGRRAALKLGALECTAGVRTLEGGNVQVAFFGKVPSKLPVAITLDDVAYTAVDAWRSGTVRDMALLLAQPVVD